MENLHWMESESVYRPHMVDFVDSLSVTLESVFLFLNLRSWVKVFNGYSTFDRGGSVALKNSELYTSNGPRNETVPFPSIIHAKARVMNFKLLSRSDIGVFMFLMSKMWNKRLARATTNVLLTRSIWYTRSGRECDDWHWEFVDFGSQNLMVRSHEPVTNAPECGQGKASRISNYTHWFLWNSSCLIQRHRDYRGSMTSLSQVLD